MQNCVSACFLDTGYQCRFPRWQQKRTEALGCPQMLRAEERALAYDYLAYALNITNEQVDEIPRLFKRAAVEGRSPYHPL